PAVCGVSPEQALGRARLAWAVPPGPPPHDGEMGGRLQKLARRRLSRRPLGAHACDAGIGRAQAGRCARLHLEHTALPGHRRPADPLPERDQDQTGYSHSMVAGGLDEMSYTTRPMPLTSLTTRFEMVPRRS